MNRRQLEHLLRAAGSISGQDRVIVIGSQSILGARPDAPASLLMSMEADFFFPNKPESSDIVDGTIGEDPMYACNADADLRQSAEGRLLAILCLA